MKEYKVWFKLLAVILSVLIGFQVAPVFAVALENGQSTSSTTKLVKPKTSSAPEKNTVSEDVLLALADKDDEQQGRVIIYLYLPLGRLTRENDEDRSVTICYNYDSNGNILSKEEYPYTTGALTSAIRTVPYTYAVSWGDQLLTYNKVLPFSTTRSATR